jgi:Zn-dependent protease with chaperone function
VQFRKKEAQARRSSRWLFIMFMVMAFGMVVLTNAILALVWKVSTWGLPFPAGFFAANTFLVLLYVFGSWAIEAMALKKGGEVLAVRAGGIELTKQDNLYEKRLCNVVMEVAVATGIRPPKVFLLSQEESINAFAAGWDTRDAVIAVTRGSMERLTREELQGIVAHEFSHILNGDMRLNMQLMSMVFGLQMLYNFGHSLVDTAYDAVPAGVVEKFLRPKPWWPLVCAGGWLIGYSLMAAGWMGWLAGALLSAGVSRQREYLADASAVKYTRLVDGLAGALRKIGYQQQQGRSHLKAKDTERMAPLFLHFEGASKWLATHPTIAERLKHLGVSYRRFECKDDVQRFRRDQFVPARLLAGGELTPHLKMAAARWGGMSVKLGTVEVEREVVAVDVPQENHILQVKSELYLTSEMTPSVTQAAILAFWVPEKDGVQEEKWKALWSTFGQGQVPYRVLVSVQNIVPAMREPIFEQLAMRVQALPLDERMRLADFARELYLNQASGGQMDWLRLAVLTYWMGEFRESMSNEYTQMKQIQGSIVLVTSFMADILHLKNPQKWTQGVLETLELVGEYQKPVTGEELDKAVRDIHDGVSLFAPVLIKTWLQAWQRLAVKRTQGIAQHDVDVFRLMCALLDTVCPEQIERYYC